MARDNRKYARFAGLALVLSGAVFLATACTLKKMQPEHPFASDARVAKSFFETTDNKGRVRLKTFLAGWAPEMSAGQYSEAVFVHYNHADHANIVFETNEDEDKLIGKMIVPSFMNDGQDCLLRDSLEAKKCRARWPNVITIPIRSRFYYERQRDQRGRETDVYVENNQRSHWTARPLMNLDLRGIRIKDWAMAIMWYGHDVDSVEDIEWDDKNGYFAFTLEASDNLFGSRIQGKFRFNFLEFKHDPSFEPTPYRQANSKHLNVLHVIGKEIDGDPTNPVLYAAHWNTKRKHTVYLHDFPKEYEQIGIDVVKEWNDAFEKVGHGRPFEVKISDRKYAFDLRYPTITWVQDRRLSASAPLGVGMALADVRNGEIRWGGVTVWGGMLEHYINSYTPNASAAGLAERVNGQKPIIQLGLMEPKRMLPQARLALPDSLLGVSSADVRVRLAEMMKAERDTLDLILRDRRQFQALANTGVSADQLNPVRQMIESLAQPERLSTENLFKSLTQRKETLDEAMSGRASVLNEMASGLSRLSNRLGLMANQMGPLDKIYTADYIQQLIKMPKLGESQNHLPAGNLRALRERLNDRRDLSKKEMVDLIHSHRHSPTGAASFCMDRRFHDVIDSYAHGLAQANVDKVQAVHAMIKDLLLHEVGHMLGIGHNFKENILPARGSVPNVSQKVGLYKEFQLAELERQAKDQFKNYTTVMGYKDGVTDILMRYEDLHPGPADILSLEYLYNKRYPIYPVDARGEGDFEFVKLARDGWILDNIARGEGGRQRVYRPAYFPNCNDITASMGMDPYCARWDRGYNATTLVQNHFDSYRGNLVSQLNAFTDTVKGDAYWMQEYALWWRSLSTFSRVRVFYDYMRQKFAADIREMVGHGSEQGIQNLLQFSETCRKIAAGERNVENQYLKRLFERRDKAELLDLCVANSITVSELDQLMQLPGKDFTQVDYFNRFMSAGVTGGEVQQSFGRVFGTWKEMARVPIKISALMTLTSPYAYSQWGGWVVPIIQYSREDGAYHMSTLYAKEYTSAIASGAEMNLTMGNGGLDQNTSIGRTVLAMGYFLNNMMFSNDILSVGAPFVENIRSQTEFRYSLALIDVEKENEDGKPIGRKFTGTIYNMHSRGPEKVPELYIYTQNRVVMRPPPGSMLLPLTPLRWYTKSGGYFYAIKMDYTDDFFDRLKTNSVRKTLSENYQEVMKKCVQGVNRNGLRFFFNKDVSEKDFPGFDFPETIAEREEAKNRFLISVEKQFDAYYANESGKFSPRPDRAHCEEAIRGQGLLVMAASVLNGFYFWNLYDYMEKDNAW